MKQVNSEHHTRSNSGIPSAARVDDHWDPSRDVNRAAAAFHAVRFWKILPRTSRAE